MKVFGLNHGDMMFICIHCGFYSKNIMDFRYIKKDGMYSDKLFKCSSCGSIFKESTLKMNLTVEEWAKLLYLRIRCYQRDEYFDKIKWEDLKRNLKELGSATKFWDSWKETKEYYQDVSTTLMLNDLIELESGIKIKTKVQSVLAPIKIIPIYSLCGNELVRVLSTPKSTVMVLIPEHSITLTDKQLKVFKSAFPNQTDFAINDRKLFIDELNKEVEKLK